MAFYDVRLKSSAERDLRRLPKPMIARVLPRIDALQAQPIPPQAIKLSNAERLYRIRVGDYRVVYEVDTKTREVLVHYIRHRRDVYRSL